MDLTASTETRIDADITVINETRIWTDLTASTKRGLTRIQHRIERTRIRTDLTASTETRIDADLTNIQRNADQGRNLTASTKRGLTRIQHRIERTRITRMFLTLMLARETVAEAAGFEPAFAAPKAAVLPLNDAPSGEDSAVSV
jgi:hypothetical protein